MEQAIDTLSIGAFAETAGVNVETIRFYQRRGLLPEPEKPYGSIRRYGKADVARVRFVKSAQRLGFSLDEVAGLLALDDGALQRSAPTRGAKTRRCTCQAGGPASHRIESVLVTLVDDCCASRARASCPLIAALQA